MCRSIYLIKFAIMLLIVDVLSLEDVQSNYQKYLRTQLHHRSLYLKQLSKHHVAITATRYCHFWYKNVTPTNRRSCSISNENVKQYPIFNLHLSHQ